MSSGCERGDQDRGDRGLVDEQLAAAEHERGGHRQDYEHADLQRPAADQEEEQAGDGDAEHHAAEQLERAAAPPAVAWRRGR